MTALLWLQAACLSAAGTYTTWGVWVADPAFSLALAFGVALALPAFRSVRTIRVEPWILAVAGVVALLGLLAPPCRVASALLLAGITILLVGRRLAPARAVGLAVLLTALLFQAQGAALFAYAKVEPRWHASPAARPLAAWILRWLGAPAAASERGLLLGGGTQVVELEVNPEILGIPFILPFTVAGILLILMFRRAGRGRSIALLLSTGLACVVIRFLYMSFLYAETRTLEIFADPVWLFATFLPFVLVVSRAVPLDAPAPTVEPGGPEHRCPKALLPHALIALAAFSLVGAQLFIDPGRRKEGRILIDEGHSEWERTDTAMDTTSFGEGSTYNYLWLRRLLAHHYNVRTTEQALTRDRLARQDVLFVKTPTRHYAPEEVDAIESFVRDGGGLLLISDHTDVFGMTTFINPVASRFGLRFVRDAAIDLSSGSDSVFQPWMAWPHPIVRGVMPLTFMTSCTLEAPLWSQDVIVGRSLSTIRPDYSTSNFLPVEDAPFREPRFGAFLQAVAIPFGEGRVIGFTDSTVFSSFSLFMPGYRELLLNMAEWLNRQNRYRWVNPILLAAALGAALLWIPLAWRRMSPFLAAGTVLSVSAGMAGAWLAAEGVGRASYPPVPARSPYPTVCFEISHSPRMGSMFGPKSPLPENYGTFFVWTQRLDLAPAARHGVAACREAEAIVFIEPERKLTGSDVERLERYLEGGGRVLVLDDPRNTSSTAGSLLTTFGLSVRRHAPRRAELRRAGSADRIRDVESDRTLVGGEPWLVTDSGDVVAAAVAVGEGRLVAMIQSAIFTDAFMGGVLATPSEEQLAISRLEFWLLERLLGREAADAGPRGHRAFLMK
jgi:hypothetical protein